MATDNKMAGINEIFCEKLNDDEMKKTIGSGNSQVRFIPDEYIQLKVLSMKNGG